MPEVKYCPRIIGSVANVADVTISARAKAAGRAAAPEWLFATASEPLLEGCKFRQKSCSRIAIARNMRRERRRDEAGILRKKRDLSDKEAYLVLLESDY
jgi:hypothetical protein